jgi:hypothetical protein
VLAGVKTSLRSALRARLDTGSAQGSGWHLPPPAGCLTADAMNGLGKDGLLRPRHGPLRLRLAAARAHCLECAQAAWDSAGLGQYRTCLGGEASRTIARGVGPGPPASRCARRTRR